LTKKLEKSKTALFHREPIELLGGAQKPLLADICLPLHMKRLIAISICYLLASLIANEQGLISLFLPSALFLNE